MNKATQQMKQETRPLVKLIREMNGFLENAEKCGVSIILNCDGGSFGRRQSTTWVVFEKCVGNCLKKNNAFNLCKLKRKLKQIERKLAELTESGYFVLLDNHNRNTYATLYLDYICMVLYGDDFDGE